MNVQRARPLTESEKQMLDDYQRIRAAKQRMIATGVFLSNALRYTTYASSYYARLAALYQRRTAQYLALRAAFITAYGDGFAYIY